jgi:hypothetical protein
MRRGDGTGWAHHLMADLARARSENENGVLPGGCTPIIIDIEEAISSIIICYKTVLTKTNRRDACNGAALKAFCFTAMPVFCRFNARRKHLF